MKDLIETIINAARKEYERGGFVAGDLSHRLFPIMLAVMRSMAREIEKHREHDRATGFCYSIDFERAVNETDMNVGAFAESVVLACGLKNSASQPSQPDQSREDDDGN